MHRNFAHFAFVVLVCQEPADIKDVVDCRNAAAPKGPAAVSFVAQQLAPHASAACTVSQASGQPASPEDGDLRCFQVFSSGVIVSFNLVAGINDDRIEVSQPVVTGDRDRVILGNIPTRREANLGDVLADAFRPVEPGNRMTCGTCHRSVEHPPVTVHGHEAWAMAGIRLNSTVRGTVPRNGQIPPEKLDQVLAELAARHNCGEKWSSGVDDALKSMAETCLRINALARSGKRFPLDNPAQDASQSSTALN